MSPHEFKGLAGIRNDPFGAFIAPSTQNVVGVRGVFVEYPPYNTPPGGWGPLSAPDGPARFGALHGAYIEFDVSPHEVLPDPGVLPGLGAGYIPGDGINLADRNPIFYPK